MEDIKPKKERKFLKAVGKVAGILLQEFVLGLGRKFIGKKIDRIGNKRQALLIFLALSCNIAFASVDSIPYPITGNKQRLGWQTTGNGLVYRGRSQDTITKPTNYVDKNVKAYLILDSVSGSLYVFKQGAWAAISGAGGGLTMPFDSITFNTAKNGTVGVGEVEYNDTQGSLIQGLKGGNVTNVIGQQLHQRVNNRTGATLNKGDVVYLSGSQGNRITVAKGLAVTDAFSANTFGVVAEAIANNASGFIITEGLITGLNTSALTEDSAVYLSTTVAGALTSTKPQAPQHSVYIGVCVKSNNGSGELFVKIRNGLELDELHDTRITNPVTGATLYYSGGLWRDTTAALLVSDTAAMLANYATKAYADTTGRFYARQDFSNVSSSTLTWTQSDMLIPGGVNVIQVYRNGQILLPSQYTVPTNATVVIAATSYKAGENYTVIFPRGGGAGSGGGSGSLTSILAGTGITVSPNPITTTGTVSADLTVLMELTDTTLLNLTSRFATKLNTTDTASLSNRINAKGNGTVTSVGSGYGLLSTQSPITTSGVIRVDSNTVYNYVRDSIVKVRIGNDTIKILKQEYAPATTSILTWTVTPKFPIQLKQYILVFRNGQLLINDQYNLTDTNKITIVSNSFKVGANYTVVTVSGIGSVGTGTFPNPVYPDAGIALSTGTTWASSITNNSSNWNTAFTDRLKWDGGSSGLVAATGRTSLGGTTIGQSMFTLSNPSTISFPRFNADNTITSRSAANFRSDIGAGTVTSVNVAAGTPLSIQNNTTIPEISMAAATGSINGYLTSTDWNTFNNKENTITAGTTGQYFRGDKTFQTLDKNAVGLGNVDNTSDANKPVSTATQTALNLKVNISDTASMLTPYLRKADTTLLNLTSRFAAKLNLSDTASMLTNYLRTGTAASLYQTKLNGTGFVKASGTTISYDNSTYLTTGTAAATYQTILTNPVTGTGTINTLPLFTGASTLGNSVIQQSSNNVGINTTPYASLTMGQGKNIMLDASSNNIPKILFYETNARNENDVQFGAKIQYNSPTDKLEFVMRDSFAADPSGDELAISIVRQTGNTTIHKTLDVTGATTLGSTLAVAGNITEDGNNVLTNLDTISLSNRINNKQNAITLTTTGTSGAATLVGSTLNIPQYTGGGGGTVTSVSGTGAISVANPTTTPVISVADAAFGTAGIVTVGAQQFSGDKTFEGITQFNGRALFKDYTYVATRLAGLSSTDRFATVTIGSGLSLSSGTLSATNTGTVTNVTGTLPISIANGTTTPSITIANASTSASGVVTTGTQSFAGNKTFTGTLDVSSTGTFGGRVNTPWLERTYVNSTSSSFTVGVNTTWLDINTNVLTTLTLPNAATYPGKELHIRQTGSGSLQSASSNIIPFSSPPTGSPVTAILLASTHRAVTLVSDGTNWIIMQRSTI